MFFRREKPKTVTFADRMSAARSAGFRVESSVGGKTRLEKRYGDVVVAAVTEAGENDMPRFLVRAGVVVGGEISALTDGGFQKFLTTPLGKRKPAQAAELKAVQDFQEDLKEILGLSSLYNESMGTVSNLYLYDRVVGRDFGKADKPWEVNQH